jgi:hypothetical protein
MLAETPVPPLAEVLQKAKGPMKARRDCNRMKRRNGCPSHSRDHTAGTLHFHQVLRHQQAVANSSSAAVLLPVAQLLSWDSAQQELLRTALQVEVPHPALLQQRRKHLAVELLQRMALVRLRGVAQPHTPNKICSGPDSPCRTSNR